MSDPMFRGDCGRCDGLCCVLLSFERGPHFAFDKPAGESCRYLGDARCAIHARLGAAGMSGCVAYDCLGAGQLVTAMFTGADRDQTATHRAIDSAFAAVRQIQALRLALQRTGAPGRAALEERLAGATASYAALLTANLGDLRRGVAQLLAAPPPAG